MRCLGLFGQDHHGVRCWDRGYRVGPFKGHIDRSTLTHWQSYRLRVYGHDDQGMRCEDKEPPRPHTRWITSVAFFSDGRRIVSGSHGTSMRLWDTETGNLSGQYEGDTSRVTSIVFSPDGKHIVSGSADKTTEVWEGDTGHCTGLVRTARQSDVLHCHPMANASSPVLMT